MDDNRAFAEKFSFPFDLLSDAEKTVGQAYGAYNAEKPGYANRYTYVIGSDGNIEHVFTSVNPQEEPADLLAKLGA